MRRIVAALALASLAACASGRYQARPVSNEAANLFARADTLGFGASLVLDVETLRELGFVPPPAEGDEPEAAPLAGLFASTLPALLSSAEKPEEQAAIARIAVYAHLVQRWNAWPHTQRLGLIVPAPDGRLDTKQVLDHAVVLLAVEADAATNRAILEGFAALGRSFRADAAGPSTPEARLEQGRLCIVGEQIPAPLCLHGGGGFYALGTPTALAAALSSANVAAPARDPEAAPDLLRLRAEMPGLGKANVRISGRTALRIEANVEKAAPPLVAKLEQELDALVAKWDEQRNAAHALVTAEMEKTRATLAADPKAPADLKLAAQTMSAETLLDPEGNTKALRDSLVVKRGEGSLSVGLTVPEALVQSASDGFGGMATISTVGILAAIAIPNFVKYQCRAKQAEARTTLRALATAQQAFAHERGAWGTSFAELGFRPESDLRYTYCMAGECLPCTHEGCATAGPNPCSIYAAGAGDFMACAYANLTGGPDRFDVWLVDSRGAPEQVSNDCQ